MFIRTPVLLVAVSLVLPSGCSPSARPTPAGSPSTAHSPPQVPPASPPETSASPEPHGRDTGAPVAASSAPEWQLRERVTPKGHAKYVDCMAFAPDGKTLATGSSDKTIKLWDVATGKEIATLTEDNVLSNALAFTPDGRSLAVAEFGGVHLWDLASRKSAGPLEGTLAVTSVAITRDGKTLASASAQKTTAMLWDLAGRKSTATLQGHSGPIRSLAFSPSGTVLASASADKTIKLWDVAGARETATLSGHSEEVQAVAFSPDGRTLASTARLDALRLWDVATGENTLKAQEPGNVSSLAFSPTGKVIAGVGLFGSVRLWDAATGKVVARAALDVKDQLVAVAFSPDGRILGVAGGDFTRGTLKLFDVIGSDEPK